MRMRRGGGTLGEFFFFVLHPTDRSTFRRTNINKETMFTPSFYDRNAIIRQPARTVNTIIGPGSGSGGSGIGNVLIGNGAGSVPGLGNDNVIIGGYPGETGIVGAVILSNGSGKVLARWEEGGTMTHTIDASQVAPDPTLNGTMATSFNPKSASLRYRVRDSSGTMRTIEVSATPAPVEIILRPVDVTQAIGDVEIDRSEALAVGALTVAVTSIKFTGKAAAPAMGGFDIAAHGVPLWAGGGSVRTRALYPDGGSPRDRRA